jgi:hypothetical protein
MDKYLNRLVLPLARRTFLWLSFSQVIVTILAVFYLRGNFYHKAILCCIIHLLVSTVTLIYFIAYQIYIIYPLRGHKISFHLELFFATVIISLALLFRINDKNHSYNWSVLLWSIILYQINPSENINYALLPSAPPNLLQSFKRIFLESFIEIFQFYFSRVVPLLILLLYIDQKRYSFTTLGLLFSSSTQIISLLMYSTTLYRCLSLILLYPMNFSKLPSSSSTSAGGNINSFKECTTCLLSIVPYESSNSGEASNLFQSVISEIVNCSTTTTMTSSSTQPKWQILNKYQTNYRLKLCSKYETSSRKYSYLGYMNELSINKLFIDGIYTILQVLSFQYMNSVCRANLNWKRNLLSDEILFYEFILKTCSVVDVFTLQVRACSFTY